MPRVFVATQSPSAERGSHPRVSRWGRHRGVPATSAPVQLQAKSCACGGSCPRCQGFLPIQPKLRIGAPNDPYEQEAERVAHRVMRMPESELRRRPWIEDAEETLQAKAAGSGAWSMRAQTAGQIQAMRGSGRPLPEAVCAFFEPRFGFDLSEVRVHTGPRAAESAGNLNARAFTYGRDIVFGENEYRPEGADGRRLLAHELVHVRQQALSESSGLISRQTAAPDFEDLARRLHDAMAGFGTDESAIFTALGALGGSADHAAELRRIYHARYGGTLEGELRGELSGSDLRRALRLLSPSAPALPTAPSPNPVRSIARDGNASLRAWPDSATGNVQGYQLTQNFRAELDPSAQASDFAVIQWIKGEMYEDRSGTKAYWPATMGLHGRNPSDPWRFTDWIIDSPDADPRFGSNRGVSVSVPTTTFADSPGVMMNSGSLPAGHHWEVDARVGIYQWGAGVPTTIGGWESQRPQPLREFNWGWSIVVQSDQQTLNLTLR